MSWPKSAKLYFGIRVKAIIEQMKAARERPGALAKPQGVHASFWGRRAGAEVRQDWGVNN
jgi:hypothetical protein